MRAFFCCRSFLAPAAAFHSPRVVHNAPPLAGHLPRACHVRVAWKRPPDGFNRGRTSRMGPTNVALVNLFRADLHLREAIARLDAAERNVRIQERRVADLAEKSKLAHTTLR